jgi:hypothetical protein
VQSQAAGSHGEGSAEFTGYIKELQFFQCSGRDETLLVSPELHAGI